MTDVVVTKCPTLPCLGYSSYGMMRDAISLAPRGCGSGLKFNAWSTYKDYKKQVTDRHEHVRNKRI
jgi:hypothetical protein